MIFWNFGVLGFAQVAPKSRKADAPTNRYALILEDPPVFSRFPKREDTQSAQGISYRQQIEAKQQALRSELASRNLRVTGSVSTLMNAVFVIAPPDRVDELRTLPGVIGVVPMRRGQKFLNKAVPLMDGPAAWNTLGGQAKAGLGMKIGILDTGIDQTHPAFQDSSLSMPAGFPKCNYESDCANFTTNKVIVARSYVPMIAAPSDPNNPGADSEPDDYSARDRDGHGTAVASSAAAETNSGTVTFSGMAPKAYLGNYKVYGSPGVNDAPPEDVWIQAIEDAFKDGMDVASFSSGLPALSGPLDTGATCGNPSGVACDPLAVAFQNAAQGGMIVVAAAGNNGENGYVQYPTLNSIATPADAPAVIAVGATTNSHVMLPSVSVTAANAPSNLQGIAAQLSDTYDGNNPIGTVNAPLVDVTQTGDNGLACSALPQYSLAGDFVLIERGTCTFATKVTNAANAGAVGVIFYMATSGSPINPEGVDQWYPLNIFPLYFQYTSGNLGPVVMISNSDGLNLKAYIDAHSGASVTIDAAGSEQDVVAYSQSVGFSPAITANLLASYSSFGPSAGTNTATGGASIKPDLVATGGYDVYLAPDPNDPNLPAPSGMYLAAESYDPNGEVYSPNRYGSADGTSFAAPLVAGAAAMVKQRHSSYTTAQVKSALVNSTAQSVTQDDFGDAVDVEWLGAGLLDANAALNATVTANPATISFGGLQSGSLPITKTITFTNNGSSSLTLAVATAPITTLPSGMSLAASPTSLTLAAGASGAVNLTLSGTVPSTAAEYSGTLALSSSGTVLLHVPYMLLVSSGTPGVPYNAVPLYGSPFGLPGQDVGQLAVQVTDISGLPVSGYAVSYSVSPRGSVTLESVAGEPACTPSTSTTSISCPTDSYGISYTEVILGSTAGATPTVTATAVATQIPFSGEIYPQPTITASPSPVVVNGASFDIGKPVAPGSYITIKGTNLVDPAALSNTTSGDSVPTTTYPITFDGDTVSFDYAGDTNTNTTPVVYQGQPGYFTFVSPNQINVQMPWELQGQSSVQVKVTLYEGIYGNVVTVPVANYSPAFFQYPGGSGIVAAEDAKGNVIGSTSNPATRGQIVELYANGLGPVNNQPASGTPADPTGAVLSTTTTTPVVMIGGQQANDTCGLSQGCFSGLTPGYPGLYQINAIVPTSLSPGTYTMTVSIGGQTSDPVNITVK